MKNTTTEELKESLYNNIHWDENSAMVFAIEFAKIHVQEALKEASENAMGAHCTDYIDKDSILNSYPLSNIKQYG